MLHSEFTRIVDELPPSAVPESSTTVAWIKQYVLLTLFGSGSGLTWTGAVKG